MAGTTPGLEDSKGGGEDACCFQAWFGRLQAVLDSIAGMAPEDRALAERVHVTVTETAPDLSPKTWYGMRAYADANGKVVVFFQDAANLDDGDLWPTSYAIQKWSPTVEKKVADLVRAAVS